MKDIDPLYLLRAGFEARTESFRRCGVLEMTEILIVDAVAQRFGEANDDVLLALALAMRASRVGHVGVDLMGVHRHVDLGGEVAPGATPEFPEDRSRWQATVLASPMLGGPAETDRPFVHQRLEDGRELVMSRRMWREQERLAAAVLAMVDSAPEPAISSASLEAGMIRLFGEGSTQGAQAVRVAAARRMCVVTGGPGTGKTYSIQRLLALFVETRLDADPLRIELAAPTGKAAVRMGEAIMDGVGALDVDDRVKQTLRHLRPRTLHKLLGMRPDGSSRHGLERRLAADLVIVDEASMIDLVLMRRLFEAMPDGGRLVLLGDRDQLASVEAGTVLADLVGPVSDRESFAQEPSSDPLRRAVVHFGVNHRFRDAPTVAAITAALQRGDAPGLAQAMRWMEGQDQVEDETVRDRVVHLAPADLGKIGDLVEKLAAPFMDKGGCVRILAEQIARHGASDPHLLERSFHLEVLRALASYRVLAVHRRGRLGVSGLEYGIARRCRSELEAACRAHGGGRASGLPCRGEHWLGRPLLMTRNAYEIGLMNGDVGVVLPTARGLAAVFLTRSDGVESTREIPLVRLPEHRGAFAMTVHKSQGSQFDRVALVLAGSDSPIQTRELVYTAISRTSARLDWFGDPKELRRAIGKRIARASGLGDLLWRGSL